MKSILQELISLLSLEQIEHNLFRGQSQVLLNNRIFGGQVLGQALSAAQQTVSDGYHIHSLHSYFLRGGDARLPVIYNVDITRNGHSIENRQVLAIQKGRSIFTLSASFHIKEEGFNHQNNMPQVDSPEQLPDECKRNMQFKEAIPESLRMKILKKHPLEIRFADPKNPYLTKQRTPENKVWLRTIETLPDDPTIHNFLLAYASDFQLLPTILFPHGVSFLQPDIQVASLDHAMWFHRPFRIDDWLLYSIDSPSANGARGLARGQFFTQQGQLVASTAQEGLIRPKA